MDKIIDLHNEFVDVRDVLATNQVLADDVCYEVTANVLFSVQQNAEVKLPTIVRDVCLKHCSSDLSQVSFNSLKNGLTNIVMKINKKLSENVNPHGHYHLRYVMDNDQYIISNEE